MKIVVLTKVLGVDFRYKIPFHLSPSFWDIHLCEYIHVHAFKVARWVLFRRVCSFSKIWNFRNCSFEKITYVKVAFAWLYGLSFIVAKQNPLQIQMPIMHGYNHIYGQCLFCFPDFCKLILNSTMSSGTSKHQGHINKANSFCYMCGDFITVAQYQTITPLRELLTLIILTIKMEIKTNPVPQRYVANPVTMD